MNLTAGARPTMTYRGALRLLGVYDRPLLDAVDLVLGGLILGSGPVLGTGAFPFGLVDHKNEGMRLIRRLLDTATDRLSGTAGRPRQELIAAAHTTIVGTALFEALREVLGPGYDKLGITDDERRRFGTATRGGRWSGWSHCSAPPARLPARSTTSVAN
jgi:hypothetical protein